MKQIITALIGFLICAAYVTGTSATTIAKTLEGPWNGEIKVAGQSLPIVFHISDDINGIAVTMDSPLQGARDIPASITVSEDDAVEIEIPAIGARFSGKYAEERISGVFSQSGLSFSLELKPGEYQVPRPQTPREPLPYNSVDVSFVNPADSAHLAGTLVLPTIYDLPMIKSVPLVVMVTGSGLQNRDEEILRHRPFAVLAHHLALNGIASLRYDDRGFGESTGDVSQATTATFASDARAAIDFARNHVDKAGSIGVLGHSEGGTIAYMLGATGDADFIVSLAGPAVSGAEILKAQNRALLAQIYPAVVVDEYVQALDIVLDYIKQNPGAKTFDRLDDAITHLTDLPSDLKQNLHKIMESNTPWLSYFVAYDPTETLATITCPVMAVNGSLDMQVDAETNSAALRAALPENNTSIIKSYPGLNHLFQHATTGSPAEYGLIEETISEQLIADIIAWLKALPK